MNADTLLARFEDCSLDPAQMDHQLHLRLTWILLRRYSLIEALDRSTSGLRRFTRTHGAKGKYHETITWAWVLAVHERLSVDGDDASWEVFIHRHPELLRRQPGLLADYYRPETLDSEFARQSYVLPDRHLTREDGGRV